MSKGPIEAGFDKLLRGLAYHSAEAIYTGHKELYRIGGDTIPEIERRIFQSNWKSNKKPEEVRLLTGLMNLLHDIDDARSREVAQRLIRNGCNPAIRSILRSILRFDLGDYRSHDIHGLRVFESKDIDENEQVADHLDTWLGNVPSEDAADVERLYVITAHPHTDYYGQYMPVLATIDLIWQQRDFGGAFFTRMELFSRELTLYHEFGHHACGHTFGQDPKQEKEADRYAAKLFKRAHPKTASVMAPIARLIFPRAKH